MTKVFNLYNPMLKGFVQILKLVNYCQKNKKVRNIFGLP